MPVFAEGSGKQAYKVGVGLRSHAELSDDPAFNKVLYDDQAVSYGVAYEYQDGPSYWQLALDYCSGDFAGADAAVDYTVTPQLNLMAADSFWRGGIGVMSTYKSRDVESDWTSIYWQFIAGVSIPLGRVEIDILAFYPFSGWDRLGKFDTSDIDYGGWLKFSF